MTSEETLAIFSSETVLFDDTLGVCSAALNLNPSWGTVSPATSTTNGSMCADGFDVKTVDSLAISNFFMKRFVWDEISYLTRKVWPSTEGAFLPSASGSEGEYLSKMVRHLGFDNMHYGDCLMVCDSVFRKKPAVDSIEESKKIMNFTFKDLMI